MSSDAAAVREYLKSRFEATLEERVQRALDVRPQLIVPYHHFSWASNECVYLYRDGYFVATAMSTQAVNEGLLRFVAERNGIAGNQEPDALVDALLAQNAISAACADAMRRILRSFRNDFHHLNPSISRVPIQGIAKRNIEDLAVVEKEIFEHTIDDERRLVPRQPKYWDVNGNGTVEVLIRFG